MRAGGGAVQQGLTSEAAAVVKQAVVLAKRRGHAQVTPLHVANTMLAASTGLLRVACQRSHSHPLQCKALDLCFNVALNRLPTSSPSHHSQYPSISNALVAAFKRAQGHQRRGSVENQQQPPLLTVKIELEQLVISILDDPSVSRVMREARFSSTQVKSNVEKAISSELCPGSSSPPPSNKPIRENKPDDRTLQPSSPPINLTEREISRSAASEPTTNDDVGIITETLLMNRKRSLVIVGESISTIESIVKDLMARVDRGEVPESLKEVKFISIPPLYSFCDLQMNLVEQKMGELACLVKSLVGKGVVLYLGDLNRVSDYKLNLEPERTYASSVEHVIMELGRLVRGIGESTGRLWLMGIATFQSYMRCRNGNHSLESVWGLHPVTIPANTLGLSLISHSDEHSEARNGGADQSGSSQLLFTKSEADLITCCTDCSSKFEAEAQEFQARICDTNEPTLSSQKLPPWLKDESRRLCKNDQYFESIRKLRLKWNSFCNSAHGQHSSRERTLVTLCSASPSPSTSCYSFDQLQNPNAPEKEIHYPQSELTWEDNHRLGSNLAHMQDNGCNQHVHSSAHNSPSSIDIMDARNNPRQLREFNAQNLNMLCDALEEKVPWQREIIPEIAETILERRSGKLRRKDNSDGVKEETWLLFLGPDDHGQAKRKISRELARIAFGSYSCFASIKISSFIRRGRDEESCRSLIKWLVHEVSTNPHRVFLLEDLEQADYWSRMRIARAIETGRIANESGEEVRFSDAIVVLSCKGSNSKSDSEAMVVGSGARLEPGTNPSVPLDLNMSCSEDSSSVENCDLGTLEHIVNRCVVFRRDQSM